MVIHISTLIVLVTSNLLSVLLGAYIAWRCKEAKPIFVERLLSRDVEKTNEEIMEKIAKEGAFEI